MVYVTIEDDSGINYLKFVTIVTAAYYIKSHNKTKWTISDEPIVEVDDDGMEFVVSEDNYRLI